MCTGRGDALRASEAPLAIWAKGQVDCPSSACKNANNDFLTKKRFLNFLQEARRSIWGCGAADVLVYEPSIPSMSDTGYLHRPAWVPNPSGLVRGDEGRGSNVQTIKLQRRGIYDTEGMDTVELWLWILNQLAPTRNRSKQPPLDPQEHSRHHHQAAPTCGICRWRPLPYRRVGRTCRGRRWGRGCSVRETGLGVWSKSTPQRHAAESPFANASLLEDLRPRSLPATFLTDKLTLDAFPHTSNPPGLGA